LYEVDIFAMAAHFMKTKWRGRLLPLCLAGTFVILLGTGLVLRPDRDAAQYLKHKHIEMAASDVHVRQLITHTRLLQGKDLTFDQIRSELLKSGSLNNDALNKMVELKAALDVSEHAQERLTLFVTVALLPPLIILELGAALFWTRRGFRVWANAYRIDLRTTVLFISNLFPPSFVPASITQASLRVRPESL
jgi:hypothetical protein